MITKPPIEDEVARRRIPLRGRGRHLVFRDGCPNCGGEDRASINIQKQVFRCRGCNPKGGDVIAFVMWLDGCDYRTALATLGCDEARPIIKPKPKPKIADDDNGARALRIWRETDILGPLALSYFEGRKLIELFLGTTRLPHIDEVIRFHPACPFNGGNRCPCVVALFRNIITNEPQAIHRTPLGDGGVKLGKPLALGPTGGAAIKLSADEDIETGLTVGEGIETTLAGMLLGFRPAWALGCAGGIKDFAVLSGIDALTILVDHDEPDRNGRRAGPDAAVECSRRWTDAGRDVLRVTPHDLGTDIADLIEGGKGTGSS